MSTYIVNTVAVHSNVAAWSQVCSAICLAVLGLRTYILAHLYPLFCVLCPSQLQHASLLVSYVRLEMHAWLQRCHTLPLVIQQLQPLLHTSSVVSVYTAVVAMCFYLLMLGC